MCLECYFRFGRPPHLFPVYRDFQSSDIVDKTIEQLDLENMGIAVGILLLCALELEI